tara:strand:- start:966 stop:1910 length:945 start_codon:yes stop_codon:yes gene_type:complete
MNIKKIINNFKEEGFINAGQMILTKDEIIELSNLCNEVYLKLSNDNKGNKTEKDLIVNKSGNCGFVRVPEHHHRLADLLNKVVSNQKIKEILEEVLGQDYKIWQIVFRKSLKGDNGLSLHQDAFGETNMCILLTDNISGNGSTFFLPKSHLLKKRIKDYGITIPLIFLKYISFLFKSFKGKKGDIGFFFNYTWHGRNLNNYKDSDVILFSFFPPTAAIGFEEFGYPIWSHDFTRQKTELSKLVDPNRGAIKREDNRYEIIKKDQNSDDPFVIKLHNSSSNVIIKNKLYLYAKISFLYIVCNTFKPLWALVKKNK